MFKVILLETLRFAHKLFIPLLFQLWVWLEGKKTGLCINLLVLSSHFEHLFRGNGFTCLVGLTKLWRSGEG